MRHKSVIAALVSAAFILSSAAASAAEGQPSVVGQAASMASSKAPVAGVRLKRSLKKQNNALPALTIALIAVAGAGAVAGAVVAATSTPASP